MYINRTDVKRIKQANKTHRGIVRGRFPIQFSDKYFKIFSICHRKNTIMGDKCMYCENFIGFLSYRTNVLYCREDKETKYSKKIISKTIEKYYRQDNLDTHYLLTRIKQHLQSFKGG